MDRVERDLLADTLRKTMLGASGQVLDIALAELGWRDLLAAEPRVAIPLVFRLLGETGAHGPQLNDVLLTAAGEDPGGTLPLPYTGGTWVVWERADVTAGGLDPALPLRPASDNEPPVPPGALAAGRLALGWWLTGTGRLMLSHARTHVLSRTQFGRPLASFQAVRHRLAETLVALEGAEAALAAPANDGDGGTSALLAKAAAGQAALLAARHCQQVLGGLGFTAEHDLHRQIRRALVLDGLLGSARDLTREAGSLLKREGFARRVVDLLPPPGRSDMRMRYLEPCSKVLSMVQGTEATVSTLSDEPAWKQRAVERSTKAAKLRAERRVQRFLDAAQAIITEKGTTDFTVQEVVDRARQSLRSFYQHFDGKHELLLALFEDALLGATEQIRAAAAGPADPLERLQVAVQLLFELCRPDPAAQRPLFTDFAPQLLLTHPGEVKAAHAPLLALFTELLTEVEAAGELRSSTKPRRAAALTMQTVMFIAQSNGVPQDETGHPISADEVWDFIAHGIAAE
jgi:AcrR family transcriptional regulator